MSRTSVMHQSQLLSAREIEILIRWVADRTKREIATELFIADATVHSHLARIRGKYRDAGRTANSKIELLIRAIEDGYITLEDVAASIHAHQFVPTSRTGNTHQPGHNAIPAGLAPRSIPAV